MVCINPKARRFDISLATSRRRQAVECCPYCGCNALWAKSYHAWNWQTIAPCSCCRYESDGGNDKGKSEEAREY
jgi:hypothetical protein